MVSIDGNTLTLTDVENVARNGEAARLAPQAVEAVTRSQSWVEAILEADNPVYGINTGFGIFADRRIPNRDAARLSRNLILSHAVGAGTPLPLDVVRAAMLVRANTLAKGYSGVRVEVIDTLLRMINASLTPIVPSQGSLGSSGDLGPLSHMALVFTTDAQDREVESGWANFRGKTMTGKAAMAAAGIPRIQLGPKEGLAVNNGATFSAAMAALAVLDAQRILRVAEASLALSLEAMLGSSNAFDPRLHEARGQAGQMATAGHVRAIVRNSNLVDAAGRVQDAYSLRCAPQVQGTAYDTVAFTRGVILREINAATDNPLLFDAGQALSGGNFHGEPVGMMMDFLGIAMAEVAAISERRTFRLTDGKLNGGLPPMLVDSQEAAGLNSGLMMPQYTAASLVLENQTLAHPDSVHSLPTSAEQEDHNANSMTAARHAFQIMENTMRVLAIELYTAARAIDLRLREMPGGRLGDGTASIYASIRERVPYQAGDTWWGPEIERVYAMIRQDELPVVVPEDPQDSSR